MQKRNLGKSMKVSSVGLGCMGITHASGTPLTKAEGMKVLESALEIGYNFRYLLDILAEVKGDSVRISFADGSSPSVIHDTSDSSAIYVLMPMRV